MSTGDGLSWILLQRMLGIVEGMPEKEPFNGVVGVECRAPRAGVPLRVKNLGTSVGQKHCRTPC
jgi:hypothetical protein